MVTVPHVELLYIDGCPHWEVAAVRLSVALQATGHADVQVHLRRIDNDHEATETQFTGSPMIRIDGVDPFAGPDQPVAFACRVFYDGDGIGAGPTVAQLVDALIAAAG